MNALKVRDVMTHLVVTLRPGDTIQEAARLLVENRISGAPVVGDGRLIGIVSEADLVAAYTSPVPSRSGFAAPDPLMFLLRGRLSTTHARAGTVREVMTTRVVSVEAEASLWEAARLIDHHGVRRLPVVDPENYVIGVLARSDLVRAMARCDEDIVSDVREAISVVGEENLEDLEIEAAAGEVFVYGTADRKTTHDIALRAASNVPGVLIVVDELDWRWDDSDVRPARGPRDSDDIGRDPWAVGPLVKEGVV